MLVENAYVNKLAEICHEDPAIIWQECAMKIPGFTRPDNLSETLPWSVCDCYKRLPYDKFCEEHHKYVDRFARCATISLPYIVYETFGGNGTLIPNPLMLARSYLCCRDILSVEKSEFYVQWFESAIRRTIYRSTLPLSGNEIAQRYKTVSRSFAQLDPTHKYLWELASYRYNIYEEFNESSDTLYKLEDCLTQELEAIEKTFQSTFLEYAESYAKERILEDATVKRKVYDLYTLLEDSKEYRQMSHAQFREFCRDAVLYGCHESTVQNFLERIR